LHLAREGVKGSLAPAVKVTPSALEGTLKLHHYLPQADTVYRVPVLVVTSLVNQPYILDLVPGQSLVEFLEIAVNTFKQLEANTVEAA
jgi:poly(3-hydroxyalkanoate) synthetase